MARKSLDEIFGNQAVTPRKSLDDIFGNTPQPQAETMQTKADAIREILFDPQHAAQARSDLGDRLKGQALALDSGYFGGWGKKTLGRVGGAVGGGLAGVVNAIKGGKLSDIGTGIAEGWDNQQELRQIQEDYQQQHPVEDFTLKIYGGLKSPIFKLGNKILGAGAVANAAVGGGKIGKAAQIATDIMGNAALGGAYGAAVGSGASDDAADYFKNGDYLNDAAQGAVFQAGAPVAAQTIKAVAPVIGKGLKNVAAFVTGTGAESVGNAYKAGLNKSKVFVDNMRGKVSPDKVVGIAREELANMTGANSDLYRENMAEAFKDTTPLNVKKIVNKIKQFVNEETLGGELPLSGEEKKVLTESYKLIKPALNSRVAQTTQGLDKIRQKIRGITTQEGTNPNRIKKAIENVIKDEISVQRPEYRKGLEAYAKNKAEINEIQKAFSLDKGKSVDTALRKLQSVGRNNVQTNYGYRDKLLQELDFNGDIANAISGQSFNAILPRGVTARMLAIGGGLKLSPITMLTSPRLVGEASYGLGRLGSKAASLRDVAQKLGFTTVNTAALTQPKKKD